jgi:hypothetical protein
VKQIAPRLAHRAYPLRNPALHRPGTVLHDPEAPELLRFAGQEPRFGHDFSRMRVHGADPGRSVPAQVRSEVEGRWNRPFGHVRLHDDARSGWAALSLAARAFSAGADIYFAPGELEAGGHSLLLHELAHVAMQDPALGSQPGPVPDSHPAEHAARSVESGRHPPLPRTPLGLYRSPLRREDFERQMRRFGVARITTGTYEDQVAWLNYFSAGSRLGDRLPRDPWSEWSPGEDSAIYDWILAAFVAFAQRLGGVPGVEEVVFFATAYEADVSGAPAPRTNVAAEFGGGRMAVYRSVTQGSRRPAGASVGGAAAALQDLTAEQAVQENVAHELGHGYLETALTPRAEGAAPDPRLLGDYRAAVGWTRGAPPALYDAGVDEVRTALSDRVTPPQEHRITADNWNDAGWVEQPVSAYATTSPDEDFSEAIAFYVTRPALLEERSPRRFAFLEARRAVIQPFLRRDLGTLRILPTQEELQRVLRQSTPPSWLRPVSPPAAPGTPSTPPLRFVPGPALEIRF